MVRYLECPGPDSINNKPDWSKCVGSQMKPCHCWGSSFLSLNANKENSKYANNAPTAEYINPYESKTACRCHENTHPSPTQTNGNNKNEICCLCGSRYNINEPPVDCSKYAEKQENLPPTPYVPNKPSPNPNNIPQQFLQPCPCYRSCRCYPCSSPFASPANGNFEFSPNMGKSEFPQQGSNMLNPCCGCCCCCRFSPFLSNNFDPRLQHPSDLNKVEQEQSFCFCHETEMNQENDSPPNGIQNSVNPAQNPNNIPQNFIQPCPCNTICNCRCNCLCFANPADGSFGNVKFVQQWPISCSCCRCPCNPPQIPFPYCTPLTYYCPCAACYMNQSPRPELKQLEASQDKSSECKCVKSVVIIGGKLIRNYNGKKNGLQRNECL